MAKRKEIVCFGGYIYDKNSSQKFIFIPAKKVKKLHGITEKCILIDKDSEKTKLCGVYKAYYPSSIGEYGINKYFNFKQSK